MTDMGRLALAIGMPCGTRWFWPLARTHLVVTASRLFVALGLSATAFAGTVSVWPDRAVAQAPSEFIEQFGRDAIGALSDATLSPEDRMAVFRRILLERFDVQRMGRLSLGRYWRVAAPAEREEYLTLFEALTVRKFAARLGRFKGESFKVKSERIEESGFTRVMSELTLPPFPVIGVDWLLSGDDGELKVVDVFVEGLSEVQSQRDDFASIIQCSGGRFEGLLAKLREGTATRAYC